MEERYKKIDELLKRLLEYREPKPNTEEVYRQTRKLLKDLMAEREIVREQFADYDEMIRREKQRRNPEYQKSLPTVDDVTGILKEPEREEKRLSPAAESALETFRSRGRRGRRK